MFPNDRLNASEFLIVLSKMGIKMSEEEYEKLWKRLVNNYRMQALGTRISPSFILIYVPL